MGYGTTGQAGQTAHPTVALHQNSLEAGTVLLQNMEETLALDPMENSLKTKKNHVLYQTVLNIVS